MTISPSARAAISTRASTFPLIIRDPRQPARGARIDAFTECVDIYPTLLEIIGARPAQIADGTSLLPFLSTGAPPAEWRDAVHWEFDFRDVPEQTAEHVFGLPSTRLNLSVIRTAR